MDPVNKFVGKLTKFRLNLQPIFVKRIANTTTLIMDSIKSVFKKVSVFAGYITAICDNEHFWAIAMFILAINHLVKWFLAISCVVNSYNKNI